ncbi:hypothetical protein AB0J90_10890 [Micromonospora sp. NPDC049523]|uniref:hypothetical protein n=1 Tax=Micromonospora sp. NPDC049523 TaxID=3155921 RepID=UPI003439DD14
MTAHIRTRSRAALAAVAVIACLALAGCGGSDDRTEPPGTGDEPAAVATAAEPAAEQSAVPPTVDACALVTKQDAELVAGTPVDDAVPVRDTCSYTAPVSGPTAQVEIYVGDGAKKILDIDRELGHEFWELPGIGDEAYAEDGAVFVSKSGQWVAIRLVRLNDPAENREPLEDLARQVAARM